MNAKTKTQKTAFKGENKEKYLAEGVVPSTNPAHTHIFLEVVL